MRLTLILASALMLVLSCVVLAPSAAAHYGEACGGDLDLRCADCRAMGRDENGEMVCRTYGDCLVYTLDDCYLDRP